MNNSIKYTSPNIHGLTLGGEVSLGGQPGNVSGDGGYSLGASYANGPVTLGAGFNYFKNPTGTGPSTGLFTDNVSGSTSLSGALNSITLPPPRIRSPLPAVPMRSDRPWSA